MIRVIPLFILAVLLTGTLSHAHPHVFVDNYISLIFDENGLAAIKQRWMFDEMTSSSFLLDYDSNHDNILTPEEVAQLKAEAFDNLQNYNYMTEALIDGETAPTEAISTFNATINTGQLTYEFTIPCHIAADETEQQLNLLIFDDEYFIAFVLHSRETSIENAQRYKTTLTTATNMNKTFYMGQLNPEETRLTFSQSQ